jgi:hypothetical protein
LFVSGHDAPPVRPDGRCPGVGSAGLALGGVTCWGVQVGEKSGARRRPGFALVEVVWARRGVEGGGPRGGGTSLYHRGGRARLSLHVFVGKVFFQHLVDSSGSSH